MFARLRKGFSFANIFSFLAFTIAATTGGAYAANTVFSTDIVDGEVKRADLHGNVVNSAKIDDGSVRAADLLGGDSSDSISVSAGAVPNGSCSNFDLSVPGVAKKQAVVLSLRGRAPEGMLFYGVRVPAAGHVTMKVCNLTGGPSPVVTNLPVRLLTFG